MTENITKQIAEIITIWETKLSDLPNDIITQKRNHQNRTIKQLIGHLIDSASNNHQRIVRLQYNDHLVFPDYTQDNDRWIAIQNYQETDWINLVQLWKCFNYQLIHIINNIDKATLTHTWTDFDGNVISLENMINGYLAHIKLHLKDVEDIINS